MGLRENCHLGAFFFLRASLFSSFPRTLARSSRAFLFVIVIFRVGRPFSCFLPGRPSMRWVGPKFAALQLAPVRVVDCCRGLAACPPSLVELIFCRHAVACLSSIGPTLFSAYFSAFPDGDSKVCVCVCVCVPSSASGCSPMLMYPGRPRPALGTPMAWHYSWHLIFSIFVLSSFFLHFPSDAISSYIHVRTSFSGARRCVCSIVSDGEA